MDGTTGYVLAVIFVATLIRSVFGFGEALIAVPLLALCLPISVAAPLAVLVSITIAFLLLLQDWRHVEVRSAGWLIVSTLGGIPLGLLLLAHGNPHVVKAVLGAIIIAFAIYAMRRRTPRLAHAGMGWTLATGFSAGILGGAYGMNGPPLAIYGAMRGWSPQQFRATLQGYFLPASMVGMAGYWAAGLWTSAVTRNYLLALPVTFAAVLLGRVLHRRISGDNFLVYVHTALIVVGCVLLAQAVNR